MVFSDLHAQFGAPFGAACSDYSGATARSHAYEKPVGAFSFGYRWLKSAFHFLILSRLVLINKTVYYNLLCGLMSTFFVDVLLIRVNSLQKYNGFRNCDFVNRAEVSIV